MSISIDRAKREAKRWAKRIRSSIQCFLLGYPKNVECTLCGWEGRRFISDGWHPKTACPNCRAGIRHRLPFAALKNIDQVSYDRIIRDKKVLHFAPEEFLTPLVRK
jgi:hypothetical protein